MPNIFAYLALISWPFITVIFYKKMPVVNATLWTIVGGFLLLPVKVEIDFPLVPAFDKESITAIAALIGIKYIKKIKITLLPKRGIERGLVILFIMVPFFTMLNNQEAINGIPGLTLHDTLSTIINQFIRLIPFIIGMQ